MAAKTKSANGTQTVESVLNAGSDAMKQSFDRTLKGFDEMASFNKQTVDAMMQSANAASKSFESVSAELLAFQKQSIEDMMAATKATMASRSMQEIIEINTDFAKSAFDSYVGQMTKLGDLVSSAAKETFEPLNTQVSAFVEKVQSART